VSKSLNEIADDNSLWRAVCGCSAHTALPRAEGSCCKEHVRDEHLHRLHCEALLALMKLEERRRRHRARMRKLKQLILPLLQTAFVFLLLFYAPAPGGGESAKPAQQTGEVIYQYANWEAGHLLSPTVQSARA
jgi:hypothetical protein